MRRASNQKVPDATYAPPTSHEDPRDFHWLSIPSKSTGLAIAQVPCRRSMPFAFMAKAVSSGRSLSYMPMTKATTAQDKTVAKS
jgi:hypothetical protein